MTVADDNRQQTLSNHNTRMHPGTSVSVPLPRIKEIPNEEGAKKLATDLHIGTQRSGFKATCKGHGQSGELICCDS